MKTALPASLENKGVIRGSIVRSMAGHDRGEVFIALRVENGFTWLADGKSRLHGRPKKKRVLHVRIIGHLPDPTALDAIDTLGDPGQRDAALRTLLKPFTLTSPKEEET